MKKLRILVVDDLFTNRLLIRELLKTMQIEFKMAENGKEAIDCLYSEDFDIVLMDIEMPVMNGLETTRYIREVMPLPARDIPIIALTAHNPKLFFEDFKEVGFNNILTKPYSLKRLQELINTLLPTK
jgi:two-component system, response regulator, stage 0 sporulation protein F